MTQIIDLLTDYGGMLAAGSTVLLGIGTVAMAIFGRPVQRQRLGELTLAATMAWLLLACVPLPRWDIGAGELLAFGEGDTYRIEESRVGAQGSLEEPLSNLVADVPVGALAVGEGLGGPENVAYGGTNVQPPASGDSFGATVVPVVESSPITVESRVGWRRTLAVSYGVGAVGCMIWLLAGHVLLARTERIATAPDKWLEDLYDSATGGRGVKRARLLVSAGCRRPAVYGIWRPVIILPRKLCRPENREQLRHVLRHESAHVWRGDARGNLIINAAFGFLFFHPLFWWIRHRIQFSRELIADDWAAGLSSKESYADELVQLVSQGRGVRLGTIGVLGVFRFNTPFYRRMKMLIDRRQPLATTLPPAWKISGILFGVMVVAAMVCVAGVPRATAEGDEGDPPAPAAERPSPDVSGTTVAPGEVLAYVEADDAGSAETEARQSVQEAIRAAMKDYPGATVKTAVDPETGRVSVTVGVPAEYFNWVWRTQQEKNRRGSRRKAAGRGGGMMGSGGAGMEMMMEEEMMTGYEDKKVLGGAGTMGMGGMGMESGMGSMGMGMGGMDMDMEGGSGAMGTDEMMDGMDKMYMGMEGSSGAMGMDEMYMGMGSGHLLQIPEDQLNRVQIEETDNIRNTVTALFRKTERDADSNASVNVSVVRDIRLDPCIVTLIDDVAIPAQTEGPVVELAVREGDRVERGQMLARIDDRRAKLKLEEAKGLLEEAQGKDLDVKYAEAVADVTSADYEHALDANRNVPGSVPKTEIRRLALELALAKIRVEQAERTMAGTRAQEAQLALAESELSDYRAEAPMDGIVVEVFPHVGEWVKSGDPICRIVRMDRLLVESRLDVSKYSPDEVHGSDVIIEIISVGNIERMPGKVTFVSPLLEADSRCRVVAEVSNRVRDGQYLLRPGTKVTMVVKLVSRPGIR